MPPRNYRLVLKFGSRPEIIAERTRVLDSDTQACDMAHRWLRLHIRSTPPHMTPCDTWVVSVPDSKVGWRIVGTGIIRGGDMGPRG